MYWQGGEMDGWMGDGELHGQAWGEHTQTGWVLMDVDGLRQWIVWMDYDHRLCGWILY